MKKFFHEFGEFIKKGNVVDLAVGIIIGSAFTKIVSSLVADILTPAISMITGNINFSDLAFTIPAKTEGAPPISIAYGAFIQAIVDFLIIAFCVFLLVKFINKLRKKDKAAEAPKKEPEPTKEEVLLTEIRDLLAKK